MFSLIDIITIGSIIILLFFLLILFVIEKGFVQPRLYLKLVLLMAISVLIFDELTYLKVYDIASWFYPIMIAILYLIYPLVYIYSRGLVFANNFSRANNKINYKINIYSVSILPLLVLIFISILYYPLDSDSKIKFIEMHYVDSSFDIPGYTTFQYYTIITYYLQTIFYIIATLRLISIAKANINSRPWELLLVRYISYYVVGVIIYESLILVNTIILMNNLDMLITMETLLTSLFIAAGLFIGFKQSLILLQSRIVRYTNKSNEKNDLSQNNHVLLEDEKKEIKEALENYFYDSKIYLNPNLKLEELSKKIHIPVKKISYAVNELYGKNFIGFLNSFRISAAKKIISENYPKIKIDEVYTNVGFNSRSTFNRVFKSLEGITPIDFITSLKDMESSYNK